MKRRTRKYLSKKGLLGAVYDCFAEIEDTIAGRDYALTDYLMCGLAVFSLKFPSLLEFDNVFRNQDKPVSRNLRNLFGVSGVPSDSGLRKRLDELNPRRLRGAFKTLFSLVQRGKVLEEYKYMDGHVLLSLDGTVAPRRCIVSTAVRSIIGMGARPITIRCCVARWSVQTTKR